MLAGIDYQGFSAAACTWLALAVGTIITPPEIDGEMLPFVDPDSVHSYKMPMDSPDRSTAPSPAA